jgi:hypothetical protein
MICLRCGKEVEDKEFKDDHLFHKHLVCNSCRAIMEERLNYLVECDKAFHSERDIDYTFTSKYLSILSKKESTLCNQIDEMGERCVQRKMPNSDLCYWHDKLKRLGLEGTTE